MTAEEITKGAPGAWRDLLAALRTLAKHPSNEISPFHCEHDKLMVMADPARFSEEELTRLDELGFHADQDTETFYSFRYGSA